jgi:hypothetical protein
MNAITSEVISSITFYPALVAELVFCLMVELVLILVAFVILLWLTCSRYRLQ